MSYHMNSRDFLVGAAIGSLLGSVAALLAAPKAGRRLRQDICDTYCDFSEATQDMACKVGKKGRSFVKNLGCQTCDWTDKAKDVVDDVAEGVRCWINPEEGVSKDLFIGGLAGGIIGAVAGLLLAPKAGSELRQDIADTYQDVSEKTQRVASRLGKQGKSVARNVQDRTGDWLDLAKEVVDRLSGQLQEKGEEVIEQGREAFQSSRLNEALEWASLGFRLWKGIKNRR